MEEMYEDEYQLEACREEDGSNTSFSNMGRNCIQSPYNEYMKYNEHDIDVKSRSNYAPSLEEDQPEHEYQDNFEQYEDEGYGMEDNADLAPSLEYDNNIPSAEFQNQAEDDYHVSDEYENILMDMRQRVSQIK